MAALADIFPTRIKRAILRTIPRSLWKTLRPVIHGNTAPQRGLRELRARNAVRSIPDELRGKCVPVIKSEQVWIAHVAARFKSTEVVAQNFSIVVDSLEAYGVPYFVLASDPNQRQQIVVSDRHASAAREALRLGLAGKLVYFSANARGRSPSRGIIGNAHIPSNAQSLVLFRVTSAANGELLSSDDLGCELQFWTEASKDLPPGPAGESLPAGTLIAPTHNRWTSYLHPNAQATSLIPVDGVQRPVLSLCGAPHMETVAFPIDVVYTWVDGDDAEWLQRKAEAQKALGMRAPLHPLAANSSRFLTRDELKFSLRSLEMYAGWVRHVFLVTDNQVPDWLDLDHPGLTVIDHKELFGDRGRLPTFNSHAIESQLHHIPGLAENFIYVNDDVFFGRPVQPKQFFHSNGTSIFHVSKAQIVAGPVLDSDWPVMAAGKNNRELIENKFGHSISNKFKHVPHALRKSVLAEIEVEFDEAHARTSSAQFRSMGDIAIPSSLAHYYAYFTGRATPGSIRYFYADIAREDTQDRLSSLLKHRNFDVFCLNDHDSSTVDIQTQGIMLEAFLNAYFPLASAYEL